MIPFGLLSTPAYGGFGLPQEDPLDKQEALRMALLQAGLGIMSARTGGSLAAALGQGGMQGVQAYMGSLEGQKKDKAMTRQEARQAKQDEMTADQFGMQKTRFGAEQQSAADKAARQKAFDEAVKGAYIMDAQGNITGIDQNKYQAALAMMDPEAAAKMFYQQKVNDKARVGQLQGTTEGLLQFDEKGWSELINPRTGKPYMTVASQQYDPALQAQLSYLESLYKGRGSNLASTEASITKETKQTDTLASMIDDAKSLLKSGPTESRLGQLRDATGAIVGSTTKAGETAARLDLIAGWMTGNVPRFEGPQSDADRAYYTAMAAKVGDRGTPAEQRLAALDQLESFLKERRLLNSKMLGPDQTLNLQLQDTPQAAQGAGWGIREIK